MQRRWPKRVGSSRPHDLSWVLEARVRQISLNRPFNRMSHHVALCRPTNRRKATATRAVKGSTEATEYRSRNRGIEEHEA